MRKKLRVRSLLWGLILLGGGCARSLEDAPCPCAEGYECCEVVNLCYPRGHACGASASASAGASSSGSAGAVDAITGVSGANTAGEAMGGSGASFAGGKSSGGVAPSAGKSAAGEGGGEEMEPDFSLVATEHNDSGRTGSNADETVLDSGNVASSRFGEVSRRPLRGAVFGQPLVVPQLSIAGAKTDVLYVATMANVAYALDARHPEQPPLWSRSLADAILLPVATIPTGAGQIWHEVGVLSTPVISLSDGALYVVSLSVVAGDHRHRLYALSLESGEVLASVEISAAGFTSAGQAQRAALTFADGVIYVPFGGYASNSDASGWIFAYDTQLKLLGSRRLGNPGGAGVTMGGQGAAADGASVFFNTSLGDIGASDSGPPFGARLLEQRSPDGADLLDRLYPRASASGSDELGGSGPLLIPGTDRVVVTGQHRAYVVSRTADASDSLVQTFRASESDVCHISAFPCSVNQGSPIFWPGAGSAPTPRLFTWPAQDVLRSFRFDADSGTFDCPDGDDLKTCPPLASSLAGRDSGDVSGHPLTSPVALSVSSDRAREGSGVVWAAHAYVDEGTRSPDGILRAFDAEDLSPLWDTEDASTPLGPLTPGVPPTVSGGRVFAGTADGITQKRIFDGEDIGDTPGIVSFDDRYLVMAWGRKSVENPGFQIEWSTNGVDFDAGNVSATAVLYEPALAASDSQIFLAYTGLSNTVTVIASDQPTFAKPRLLSARTSAGDPRSVIHAATTPPALAYGDGHLFLAFTDDRVLNVVSSVDGSVFDMSTLTVFKGYYSEHAPMLSYVNGKLYMVACDNYNQLRLFVSSNNGASFDGPTLLGVTSSGHPALLAFESGAASEPDLYFAWSDVTEIGPRSGPIKVASSSDGNLQHLLRTHDLSPELAALSLNAARFRGAWYLTWLGSNGAPLPNLARYSPGELVTYGLRAH